MSVNTDIKEEAPNLIDLINEGFTSSIVQLDYAIKRVGATICLPVTSRIVSTAFVCWLRKLPTRR